MENGEMTVGKIGKPQKRKEGLKSLEKIERRMKYKV
jgi:hypothetical protein